MKRMFGLMMVAALVATFSFGTAKAEPGNGAQDSFLTMVCAGEEITIVIHAGGPGATVVEGDGSATVSRGVDLTVTQVSTGAVVSEYSWRAPGERLGQEDDIVACTHSRERMDPELGLLLTEVTVYTFIAPRRGG